MRACALQLLAYDNQSISLDRPASSSHTTPNHPSNNLIATEIQAALGQQRHTLEDGSEKVREMKGFAGHARRVLNDMSRRAALHKCMLYLIIVLLLLAIAATLYRLGTHNGRIL